MTARTKIINVRYHNLDNFEMLHISPHCTIKNTTFHDLQFHSIYTISNIYRYLSLISGLLFPVQKLKYWSFQSLPVRAILTIHHIYALDPDIALFYGDYRDIAKLKMRERTKISNDIEKTGEINEKWQKKKYILEKEEDKMEPISKGNGK